MPTLSAMLILGSERGSSWMAGWRRWERSAKSARKGRWTRKLSIAVVSVGGLFSIVAWSAAGSLEMAAKVSAISVNRTALMCATGATWAAERPSWRKNWSSWVSGSAKLCMTGVRWRKNGFKAAIAVLIDWPRPVKASPKPSVAVRMS